MVILNLKKSYSRFNNILYADGIPIVKFTYSRFPDFEVLRDQGVIYMQNYINSYKDKNYYTMLDKDKLPIKRFFFDVETTGLKENVCSIHQFSAMIEIDGEIVETINLRLRPHDKAKFEDEAVKMSGLTIEEMMQFPPYKEQFKKILAAITKYVSPFEKNKLHLLGFKNASFDDGFLKKLFSLCGEDFWLYFYASSIDVSCLAADYLEARRPFMPSFKLHRVAKTLGIYVDDSKLHDSLYDIELTRKIYRIVKGLEEEDLF